MTKSVMHVLAAALISLSSWPAYPHRPVIVNEGGSREKPVKNHDMSFDIVRGDELIYRAEGLDQEWRRFYEKYGRDHYCWGPEYDREVEGGACQVKVTGPMVF